MRRPWLAVAAMIALVGCAAPPAEPSLAVEPLPFERLHRGTSGNPCPRAGSTRFRAITRPDDPTLAPFLGARAHLAALDFERYVLMAVLGPTHRIGGRFRVHAVERTPLVVRIHVESRAPGAHDPGPPEEMCPHELIRIARLGAPGGPAIAQLVVNGTPGETVNVQTSARRREDAPTAARDDKVDVRFVFAHRQWVASRAAAALRMRSLADEIRDRGFAVSLDTSRCAEIPAVVTRLPRVTLENLPHGGVYDAVLPEGGIAGYPTADPYDFCMDDPTPLPGGG